MVMLGVIANPLEWAAFSDEWQECLDMRPTMKALHMTDLMWRESDEAKERAARFYRILCSHVKGTVVVSMPLNDYHQVFAQSHPLFRNPYFIMFFLFIRCCRMQCPGMGLSDEMQFIFDEQSGIIRKLAEGWAYFLQYDPKIAAFLGEFPSFRNDKNVLPLQASDFMAWWVRRVLSDEIEGRPKMEIPWNFQDEIPFYWGKYDRAALQWEYDVMIGG